MTNFDMRVAIHQALGWKVVGKLTWKEDMLDPPKQFMLGCGHEPDYPNDLNAMHEAEKTLDDQQKEDFVCQLSNAAQFRRRTDRDLHSDYWCVVHATAAQRAEAFLRTIGKWKE